MAVSNTKERFAQEGMAEIALQVLIRPGIPSKERKVIEDSLMEVGCEVAGGGGFHDGTESDISVLVHSVKHRLPIIMRVLQDARVGRKSIVSQSAPKVAEYKVYGGSQSWANQIPSELADRPWWKFW
ncbi:MAG: hypothetical protein P8J27_16650 [Mariniblastus sp.]|nr:hypothetical protein [Mariniblastus sp.]